MIDRKHLENIDWVFFSLALILSFLGVITIYSVTASDPGTADFEKQILWIFLGLAIIIVVNLMDYRVWMKPALPLYLIVIAGLLYVLQFGLEELGVKRWIVIWDKFRFQPSEYAKLAVILMVSKWLTRWQGYEPKMRQLFVPSIIAGVPIILILLEPDLGTALALIPCYICMIFVSGFSIKKMLLIAVIAGIAIFFTAPHILKPYQIRRVTSFLHPEEDPLGAGYHLLQSQIAIGSGGFSGQGYQSGSQSHLDFLPVQDTDFIFAVWGEERGFVGGFLLLSLYMLFILRALRIARHARDFQGMYFAIGLVSLIFTQIVINIGMVIGLMPITGLPLPFMSYGGSSISATYFAVGMILNIGMRRFDAYSA